MNRLQAEQILALYRPDTADANDPEFAEALRLVQGDPELAHWFADHCARYKKIRSHFKKISVPAGLKEQIVAEREIEIEIKYISPPRSFWLRPAFAMVALIIVLLCLAAFWFPLRAEKNYSNYRNRMISTALRNYAMDLETDNLQKIQSFLAQKNAPAKFTLPSGLQVAKRTGCVVLRWQNRPVSMICFRTGKPLAAGQKSDLFLFVMDRSAFATISATPKLEQIRQLATARWTDGNKFYLLATVGDENALRKFL